MLVAGLLASLAIPPATDLAAAGLPMLLLNSGSRGAALGDAMAAVPDVDAASANPAALAAPGGRALALGHTAWIQDVQISNLALNSTTGRTVWGVAARLFQADDLERRTGPSMQPVGYFGVYEGAINLVLAHAWRPRVRLGASVLAIRQTVASEAANGAAVDLGVLCRIRPDLQLGLAARHLGRMGELSQTATELPLTITGGMSFSALPRTLLSLQAQQARDAGLTLHAGVELALEQGLVVRAGYQTADSRGLSGGLGIKLGAWNLDYAYVPFDSGLGQAHRLGLQLHR